MTDRERDEGPRVWKPIRTRDRCPRCDSPAPHLHPATQHEGEVQVCSHQFHQRITPENKPEYRQMAAGREEADRD